MRVLLLSSLALLATAAASGSLRGASNRTASSTSVSWESTPNGASSARALVSASGFQEVANAANGLIEVSVCPRRDLG